MADNQDRQREMLLDTRNGLSQYDEVVKIIDEMNGSLALTPEIIKHLHHKAMDGLLPLAGSYRTLGVRIRGSPHHPPPHAQVSGFVDQMCDDVNQADRSPIQIAAFVLWRLNWIHPFVDGNGRTSRAVSYLVLCVSYGRTFPGTPTIPEQLTQNRIAYYEALRDADEAWLQSVCDLGKLEFLLGECLIGQLKDVN